MEHISKRLGEIEQNIKVNSTDPISLHGFTHVLLGDGVLLGHWRVRRDRSGTTEVETRLAREIDDDERTALDAAAERYEKFVRT